MGTTGVEGVCPWVGTLFWLSIQLRRHVYVRDSYGCVSEDTSPEFRSYKGVYLGFPYTLSPTFEIRIRHFTF